MGKSKLTILTPTYNRASYLPKLISSLQAQTVKDFDWLIIDDGSADDTQSYIENLSGIDFPISYYKKENGGKHTALNYAHKYIKGEYVLILDSDDYLVNNAVETIIEDWEKYEKIVSIGMLSYEKCHSDGRRVSEQASTDDYYIGNNISHIVNKSIGGDRCEVVRTKIFKEYIFPSFPNEKFVGEGWLWNNIALKYDTVYRNEAVYICEYLENGLTKNGIKNRMKSPFGMMEYCKSYFTKEVCWKVQFKEMLLYCVYGLNSSLSIRDLIVKSDRRILMILILPLGYVLYLYWRVIYK